MNAIIEKIKIFFSGIRKKPAVIVVVVLLVGVIFLSAFTYFSSKNIQIKNVSPKPNESSVDNISLIKIIFNKNVSENSQKQISIKITPEVSFQYQWLASNQILITPSNPLASLTTYTIQVYSRSKAIYQWSFTSKQTTEEKLNEQAKTQAYADLSVSNSWNKLFKEKPWLEKLPLTSSRYVAVYDYEKDEIRVRITLDAKNTTPRETQISQIKTAALKELTKIGVDTKIVKINWVIGI